MSLSAAFRERGEEPFWKLLIVPESKENKKTVAGEMAPSLLSFFAPKS